MVKTFNKSINQNWIEWFVGFCDAEAKNVGKFNKRDEKYFS
jgi:hypothetical protein